MRHMHRYLLVGITAMWAPLAWTQSPTINGSPSREFGQLQLTPVTSGAPNLLEGREFWNPQSIAFDNSVSPPAVYVADTLNNRVLGWKVSTNVGKGNFADLVVGQRDMMSANQWGPGTALSAGLTRPTAILVDPRNGSLYVMDAANNRILRYPNPFNQSGSLLSTDLVIGQASISSGNQSNQAQGPGPTTLFLCCSSGQPLASGMAFDSSFNLWVADPGNNRVLRFPAANLQAGTAMPAADIALGQNDLNSALTPLYPNNTQVNLGFLVQPTSLAFDAKGRLYVSDSYSRVLFFDTTKQPLGTGRFADRVLGVVTQVPSQPRVAYPNAFSLGIFDVNGNLTTLPPLGVFTQGNTLFVADTGANRIVQYPQPETWPAVPITPPNNNSNFTQVQISPPIAAVLGQSDMVSGKPNRGNPRPDPTTFSTPVTAAFNGTGSSGEMWVVDGGNNRVISIPFIPTLNFQPANRVLGQLDFPYNSPNLIVGEEAFFSPAVLPGAGVVIDKSSSPPHLYIADSQNNRILAFKDARTVVPGSKADLVIGQADFFSSLINFKSNVSTTPFAYSLNKPMGLVVDASGNLLVADSGNGRVLRFPSPFSQTAPVTANLVLGQLDFTSQLENPSPQNMGTPFGLALFSDGSLAVSDEAFNRVLIFKRPTGGDFSNFQTANVVLGQQDFFSVASGIAQNQLKGPAHMATDTSDRLYVCDPGNNRMAVFPRIGLLSNGATAVAVLSGLAQPQSVAVSSITGEIWLANTYGNQIGRFPVYETLFQSSAANLSQATAVIDTSGSPLAITLDASDNLIAAEADNRVEFFYAELTYQNTASYNQQPLAPGQLAILYRLGAAFNFTPAAASSYPWPYTLGDLQVFVNNIPAPIFRVDATSINFQVPMSAPSSGNPTFTVMRASTGETLAAAQIPMGFANPAFFTTSATGTGPVAAINDDGTINSPTNPISRGHIISFYLTGQGFVSGGPPDGSPPTGPVSTPVNPRITMIPGPISFLPDTDIQYSGLGAFPGGWQLNVVVPMEVPPSGNVLVVLTMDDVPSNIGPGGSGGTKLQTTFSVKQ